MDVPPAFTLRGMSLSAHLTQANPLQHFYRSPSSYFASRGIPLRVRPSPLPSRERRDYHPCMAALPGPPSDFPTTVTKRCAVLANAVFNRSGQALPTRGPLQVCSYGTKTAPVVYLAALFRDWQLAIVNRSCRISLTKPGMYHYREARKNSLRAAPFS